MHDLTIEEVKEKIVSQWDAVDFCDYLEIGIEELVEAFNDKIEEYYVEIIQALEE
jgi:hypothetical protein